MKTTTRYLFLIVVLFISMAPTPATAALDVRGAPESGEFTIAGFAPTSATPIQNRCRLEGDIAMDLTGALNGTAHGSISVLIHAPCREVTANPPGTFRDKFAATLAFSGDIAGRPEYATIAYTGHTQPGGATRGIMRVDGDDGTHGALRVEAQAGAGGTYVGSLTP